MSKVVRCLECGFLALVIYDPWSDSNSPETVLAERKLLLELGMLAPNECSPEVRNLITEGTIPDADMLVCARRQWNRTDYREKPKDELFSMIQAGRQCAHFYPFNPGDSPLEHKRHQEVNEGRRAMRNATLLGALVGGGVGATASGIVTWLIVT